MYQIYLECVLKRCIGGVQKLMVTTFQIFYYFILAAMSLTFSFRRNAGEARLDMQLHTKTYSKWKFSQINYAGMKTLRKRNKNRLTWVWEIQLNCSIGPKGYNGNKKIGQNVRGQTSFYSLEQRDMEKNATVITNVHVRSLKKYTKFNTFLIFIGRYLFSKHRTDSYKSIWMKNSLKI